MRKPLLSRTRQGELFCPPAQLPDLPAEVRQRMARLLAACGESRRVADERYFS